MIRKRVLIVDDEPSALAILERSIDQKEYEMVKAYSGEHALELFCEKPFPVVVTDVAMPGISGIDLLVELRKREPDVLVLIMTAYADLTSSINAIRSGAYDYIVKPCKPEFIIKALERAFEKLSLSNEVRYLKSQIEKDHSFQSIVGISDEIRQAVRTANRIARTDECVLITGESGTGKEMFARAIHQSSHRKNNRFVPVNCAAFPDNLIESELFGYVKGAFTGADRDTMGLIEEAHNGTIFFDEISELVPSTQVKLLRFLQDHNIRRVGSTKEKHVNVRIIAATNRSLEDMVASGAFRDDLLFRLRVLTLRIPALCDRVEDITVYLNYFLDKFSRHTRRETLKVSDEVMEILNRYLWPGNVRELENLTRHLVVMCDGPVIEKDNLPSFLFTSSSCPSAYPSYLSAGGTYSEIRTQVLENFNQSIIAEALELESGNISRAAERLGTAKSNVIRLMKRFNMLNRKA